MAPIICYLFLAFISSVFSVDSAMLRSEVEKEELILEFDQRGLNRENWIPARHLKTFNKVSQNIRANAILDANRRLPSDEEKGGAIDEPEFCPNCLWHDGRTCEHRKNQVMERQHKDEEEASKELNEAIDGKPSPCLKVVIEEKDATATAMDVEMALEAEIAKEESANAKAEEIEKKEETNTALLEAYRAVFCGSCSWHGGISCDARRHFLHDKYGTPELEGMQVALEKVDGKCLKEGTILPTEEKKMQFCETCIWAAGIKCRHRVQFMMTKYRMTEQDSIDHAMLDGKCIEED